MNFRRVAKQAKWYEAQLQLFAKEFASAVDKRIKVVLEPFRALPSRIDDFSDLRKYLAATPEEYAKINYANNKAEYSTIITSLTAQRRHYLLMDVYDDMMLDGVKPGRDTFHSLLISTMKGARLQDAFIFRDQSMVFIPDRFVALKVQKSAPHYTKAAMDEITLLKQVAECDLDDKKCVAKLLDNFKHSGPNGQHACIVFEYVVGLDYLHKQLSIIHTNLKPESVPLCSTIDPSKDPRKSGKPLILPNHKDKTTLDGGAPKGYAAGKNEGPKKGSCSTRRKLLESVDLKCKVVDFGSACWTYKQFTDDNFGLSLAFVLSLKLATCYLILTVMITLTELRYAIVRDITAAGLGLNKFCYAGLIAAHKNKEPVTDDLAS
ncbi:Pentatricopeptide repeat-containing protein, mitochondrial [Capsicum chinense]|nr:Pentatricopeptide repeat-containing protein, mitochondrial [Capsicum chinense]